MALAGLSISQSHLPLSVFMYFFQVHGGPLKLGGITAPALLPYLFQNKHNQNLKAREKLRQKRYTWIGNFLHIFQ